MTARDRLPRRLITTPHDTYIEAVGAALAAVGLDATGIWTANADTRGLHQYLNAALTLTPEDSTIDPTMWPEGLILIWEWHSGKEENEDPRGPVWLWAKKLRDGGNSEPAALPIDGYANPVQVAAAADELTATGKSLKPRPGQWAGAPALEADITAWENTA